MSDETPTGAGDPQRPAADSADDPQRPQAGPASDRDAEDATDESAAADDETRENEEFAVRVRRYLDYAVLVGLLLLSLVAALQFYLNASQTISTWVTPEYRAPFHAVFNLALLLAAAFGISVEVRRITSNRS